MICCAGGAGLVLLFMITILSFFFYLNTDHCSGWMQRQINSRIPGNVEWERLALSPTRGAISLKGFRLMLEDKELASVAGLDIGLDLLALPKRVISINDLTIDTPRVALSVGEDGVLDILKAFPDTGEAPPERKKSGGGLDALPFNVVLGNLTLIDGHVIYHNFSDQMRLELLKLSMAGKGNLLEKALDLTVRTGQIDFEQPGVNLEIDSVALDARYLVDALDAFSLSIRSNAANMDLTGAVRQLLSNAMQLDLSFDATLATASLAKSLSLEENISGDVTINGKLMGSANDPMLRCSVLYPDAVILGRSLKKASFDGVMEKRVLTISALEIDHEHGTVMTKGEISLAEAFPEGFLAAGHGRDLSQIAWDIDIIGDAIEPGKILEQENVKGVSGRCDFTAGLRGTLADPKAEISFNADKASYLEYPPLDADIDLSFSQGVLSFDQCDLSACSTRVVVGGSVTLLEPINRNGSGQEVAGQTADVDISNINDEEMGEPIKGESIPKDHGASGFAGRLLASPILDLIIDTSEPIDLSRCFEALAHLEPVQSALNEEKMGKLAGTVALHATLKGPTDRPLVHLDLNGDDIEAAGEKISGVLVRTDLKDQLLTIPTVKLTLGNQSGLIAKGTMALKSPQKIEFNVRSFGQGIDLTKIEAIAKSKMIRGIATCDISATGSVEAPEVTGKMKLQHLVVMEKPLEDFSAKISLKNKEARVEGAFDFDIDARYALDSGAFSAKALFDHTDLFPWLVVAGIKDITGELTGAVSVKGNAATPDQINARCDIDDLAIRHQSYGKASVRIENMRAWSDGERFEIKPFTTRLPEQGNLTLSASGELTGMARVDASAQIPLSVASIFVEALPSMEGAIGMTVNGKMDLGSLSRSSEKSVDTNQNGGGAGQKKRDPMTANVKTTKNHAESNNGLDQLLKNAALDATLSLESMAVTLPDDLGRLESINGRITADLNHIDIPRISGKFGAGRFELTGNAGLHSLMPEKINAQLRASKIPLDMVDGLEGALHSNLILTADLKNNALEKGLLRGTVALEDIRWSRDISVEKTIFSTLTERKRVRKTVNSKKTTNPLLDRIGLDIAVKGKTPLIVDNNLAYMEIHPNITIQGTAGTPKISGRSEINPGTITYQFSEFTLTRGIVDFVNPYALEPELDIESHRMVRDWEVMLSVSGTPNDLNFSLSSDPQLEDGDILSLLLRGKTVSELISAEGGTTLSAAGMLSEVAASTVSDNVKSATGLDIFEMGFGNDTDDNSLSDINVTVGKKITDKITVKYGAETEDGEMIHKTTAEYKMTDSVSVSGFQDSAGQFGGEVRYRLEFD